MILSSALAIVVSGDILRFNYPPFEKLYERCLGFLMRESEKVCGFSLFFYFFFVFLVADY
jgi:diacylglycerol kinase (CTP)